MSAETMPTITEAQVATLVERLDGVMRQQSEIKGMLQAQAAQLGAIPVMQATITEHGEKLNRAFGSIRETRQVADDAKHAGQFHGTVLRIAGTLLLSCFGLVGWHWKQLDESKDRDSALERRILLTEYKLGIPPVAEGGK